ncbi:MAG: non-canonical purine NTP diphosphatase [Marinilabiliaceae bacterium]|nr:non-canonical purine NTP diphosphatase [Marinilabiliaceae bacterium]
MDLVFATNNENKLKEIQQLLGASINILSLKELGCFDDIPETGDTLEANALQKARYIYERYGKNCFADDTGLEVDVLNGAPGVYSARYAGEEKSAEKNMDKILSELQDVAHRNANFRTVVALIIDGKEFFFEGKVKGSILKTRQGKEGFGYDPIFQPAGYSSSFAQMAMDEKNKTSHRGRAVKKLVKYLKNYL